MCRYILPDLHSRVLEVLLLTIQVMAIANLDLVHHVIFLEISPLTILDAHRERNLQRSKGVFG